MPLFFSPAKVNLFLRVLSKRPDGYHEIASLFQVIDLFDELYVDFAERDTFTCSDPELPTDQSNLVIKACELFRNKTNTSASLRIHLEKKIPSEAGLGGGSSNAATMLWALNKLYGDPVSLDDLRLWSSKIGSDIPFFFSLGTAFCSGRGELIKDEPALTPASLYIVRPPCGLSTPRVYGTLDLSTCSPTSPEVLLDAFRKGQPQYVNDLEAPAFLLMPKIAELKSELCQKYGQTIMTGSGTALCCFSDKAPVLESGVFFTQRANYIRRLPNEWYGSINDKNLY